MTTQYSEMERARAVSGVRRFLMQRGCGAVTDGTLPAMMPSSALNIFAIVAPILGIFAYAVSPYEEWHRLARADALVLIVLMMVSVTLVRVVTERFMLKGGH